MDNYEATKIVLSRIQSLDPENASKIMGFILIQDHGEKEMIRLAFGPETRLLSLITQAKTYLGLNPFAQSSPRIIIPNNGFHLNTNQNQSQNPSSPSSPWGVSDHRSPKPSSSLSYAAVVNGSTSSPSGSFSLPFYNNSDGSEDLFDGSSSTHRRSFSVSDVYDEGESGFGWRPCMYFARGFCKNGSTCKFVHGESGGEIVGSPSKMEGFDDLLRMKAIQQQRFAAMAGANFPYNRCIQRSAAAALMMGDEFHKFGRCRPERNDFAAMGLGGSSNSSSRQIYLTFPADSTFKEEDVSNYFSMYGPVQDVRIPYQQKRMFGFVTFLLPETVKQILAKGNPHFVCDSRVLVKPYKEKGKIPDKKQHQMECLSPSGLDSMEPFDSPIGPRMFYNTQEMMLRRKLEEEAELQQAIEYQGRRLMNFQLAELKNHHHHHNHNHQLQPGFPIQSHARLHQNLMFPTDGVNQEVREENSGGQDDQNVPQEINEACNNNDVNESVKDKEESSNLVDSDLHESFEHILPDNLFASPTKSVAVQSIFTTSSDENDVCDPITASSSSNSIPIMPTNSTLNMASTKSCYFETPRFSSGQEAIEM